MPEITVNHEKFDAAIRELYAIGGEAAIRPQAGLLVQELVNYTPPLRGQGGPTAQRAGLLATERDFRRAVTLVDVTKITDPDLKKEMKRAIRQDNRKEIEFLIQKITNNSEMKLAEKLPREQHEASRTGMGRVTRPKNRATLSKTDFKQELARLRSKVGALKAAWIPAAAALGVMDAAHGFPSYVTRHKSHSGPIQDDLKNPDTPSIRITALGKGLGLELGPFIQRALAGRTKAMVGNIKHSLLKLKEKHRM